MKNETIEMEEMELTAEELLQCDLMDDEGERRLQYIPVDKLFPHPDNPRKELGDLTELAESIKVKGVMQNLTVVKGHYLALEEYIAMSKAAGVTKEVAKNMYSRENAYVNEGYTIIIGHRRCAAAKLAGLSELPCVVVEMTPEEQVATMLLENMQRVDLTPFEQAQGFQMMLDLGDSVNGIAEKTGFSKSTVRRRLKLTELDQKLLQEASGRQVSLLDLERLEKIEDIKERNKVLKSIGTNNFERDLANALSDQKNKKLEAACRAILAEYGAIEIKTKDKWDYDKYRHRGYVNVGMPDKLSEDLEQLKPEQIYFCIEYGSCYLRTPAGAKNPKEEAAKLARQKAEDEREVRRKALTEAFERAYELRTGYIKKLAGGRGALLSDQASDFIIKYSCLSTADFDPVFFLELIGLTDEEIENCDDLAREIRVRMIGKPSLQLFVYAYAITGDCKGENCCDWDGRYVRNNALELIYEYLEKIGYEMSDEEKALADGAHELYLKEDANG